MPKWADRSKAVIGKSQTQFQRRSLDETKSEARDVIEHIKFIVDSSDLDIESLQLDRDGLDAIESFYRDSVKNENEISLGVENFERLMSLALGQFLVNTGKGEWAVYEGESHVFDPIVIRLKDGSNLDVFVFCAQLAKKNGVDGASTGRALTSFIDNAESLSFE